MDVMYVCCRIETASRRELLSCTCGIVVLCICGIGSRRIIVDDCIVNYPDTLLRYVGSKHDLII
jgi:hypothetical protein